MGHIGTIFPHRDSFLFLYINLLQPTNFANFSTAVAHPEIEIVYV